MSVDLIEHYLNESKSDYHPPIQALYRAEEACKSLKVLENAVSRLSPAVRELLVTNPEAVEKAVEAAVAHKALNDFLVAFNPTEPHTVELRKKEQDLKRHLQEIRCKYIAALSKPGRDEG